MQLEQADAERRRRASLRRALLGAALAILLLWVIARMGLVERLAYVPSRDVPPTPAGAEDVWFKTADGLKLHGWFLPALPSTVLAEATVVALHGNAGNVGSHIAAVDFLPQHGFNVLLFDYRSYGRSDRGTLRRDKLLIDARSALEYVATRSDVREDRIVLYAQSLGGVFGLALAEQQPRARALVVVSTFSSWREIVASSLGSDRPGSLASRLARWLMPSGLDPIDSIRRVKQPVMLIHGTADEIVPYPHSERLERAGGANVTLRAVVGGDHNGLRWFEPKIESEIAAFYRRSLAE